MSGEGNATGFELIHRHNKNVGLYLNGFGCLCFFDGSGPNPEWHSKQQQHAEIALAAFNTTTELEDAGFNGKAGIEALPEVVAALELVMPLAKGYHPENQSKQARITCDKWRTTADEVLSRIRKPNGGGNE